jgi:hypothetical protein
VLAFLGWVTAALSRSFAVGWASLVGMRRRWLPRAVHSGPAVHRNPSFYSLIVEDCGQSEGWANDPDPYN